MMIVALVVVAIDLAVMTVPLVVAHTRDIYLLCLCVHMHVCMCLYSDLLWFLLVFWSAFTSFLLFSLFYYCSVALYAFWEL